ncbi:hypothetical protein TI39_contig807g00001 [Zymoseptoria brevis]|uniref:Cercosporin MFS transporter CTB4 n=1 Tax=Zymoseptoria brevis TaxID=1047168 RepID=A0A0F4GFE5_9PEZI|nr:hypothetical protein TI39_contig807g00001 [Zymoseptoria brevis]
MTPAILPEKDDSTSESTSRTSSIALERTEATLPSHGANQDDVDVLTLPYRTLTAEARMEEYTTEVTGGLRPVQSNKTGRTERYELVTFEINDPANPKNFSRAYKWWCTLIVAITCFAVAFDSAVITADVASPAKAFGVSEEVSLLAISLFVVGFGIGPMAFAPLSEILGRQKIYISTLLLAVVFIIPCAVAPNIETLLVCRAIDGIMFSAPMTLVGGTLADLWNPNERGVPMAVFSAAPFIGPAIGPLAGGFIADNLGWRWLYWMQLILSAFCYILITFTVPETYAPEILARRAEKMRKETGDWKFVTEQDLDKRPLNERLKVFLLRPFQLLFQELIVFFLSLYMSVLYGLLYMFFIAYPIVYQEGKGYSASTTGLMFIPVAVGVLMSAACAPLVNKHYLQLVDRHHGKPPAEARLIPMMFSCWFIPIGLFVFAWTSYPHLHWSGPALGGWAVGFGFIFLYNSCNNYLVDSYQHQAASALAAKTFLRSFWGAAVVLFTIQMYHRLGDQWASTLLAFIALACCAIPFVFYYKGSQSSGLSDFIGRSHIFGAYAPAQVSLHLCPGSIELRRVSTANWTCRKLELESGIKTGRPQDWNIAPYQELSGMNTPAAYISQATLMNDMDPCVFYRINWAVFVTGPGTARDDLINVTVAANEVQANLSAAYVEIYANEKLFQLVDTVYQANVNDTELSEEQQIVLSNLWGSFSDLTLSPTQRDYIHDLGGRVGDAASKFEENANAPAPVYFTAEELEGVPMELLNTFDKTDATGGNAGKLSFDANAYSIYVASRIAPENEPILEEYVKLQLQIAQFYNYTSYADYALAVNIAQNHTRVNAFLEEIRTNIASHTERDVADIAQTKQNDTTAVSLVGERDIAYQWDGYIYLELERENLYNVNVDKIKEYFPVNFTIPALLSIYGFPAQFMENYPRNPEAVKRIARHWSSLSPQAAEAWRKEQSDPNAPLPPATLPDDIAANVVNTSTVRRSLDQMRQVAFSTNDQQVFQATSIEEINSTDYVAIFNDNFRNLTGLADPSDLGQGNRWGYPALSFTTYFNQYGGSLYT